MVYLFIPSTLTVNILKFRLHLISAFIAERTVTFLISPISGFDFAVLVHPGFEKKMNAIKSFVNNGRRENATEMERSGREKAE